MKYLFGIIATFLFLSGSACAAESPLDNAGFVPANIWYSQEPIFAGDRVRVYTIVFNGSTYDLSGSVEFYDNGVSMGSMPFVLAPGGRVRDLWVDWTAKEGKHTITAKITKTLADQGGKKVSVTVENLETGKSERVIEQDTDGDDVGNSEDADDDGDGVSDVDEIKYGTNPLIKDSDGDGISDKQEIADMEAARQKAEKEALLAQASSTSSLAKIEEAFESTKDSIPEPVKSAVASSTNMLEDFRIAQGYDFKLKKEEALREVYKERQVATSTQAHSTTTSSQEGSRVSPEKPLAYMKAGFYGMLQYVFQWKILFYGVVLAALFYVLKFVVKRVRNRDN